MQTFFNSHKNGIQPITKVVYSKYNLLIKKVETGCSIKKLMVTA